MKHGGLYTALVTPFHEDKIDEEGLRTLISFQKKGGVDGILLLGTTGEAPTLSIEEKKRILKIGKKEMGSLAMMVGVGSASTQGAIELAKMGEDYGADSLLVVAPYYNKPTQDGLYQHFEAISTAVKLPILVYTIPGRCGVNVEVETLKRLAEIPNIVGVKEASNNIIQIESIIREIKSKKPHFSLMSGDDGLTFSIMALGGDGVISTTSNLFPKKMKDLVTSLAKNDLIKAREYHFQLTPLFQALFVETNPIPLKAALSCLGLPGGELRLPLTNLSSNKKEHLFSILRALQ